MRIKPLSIQLANQIAAGEVVERPASVLKELLENSIDAGSNMIEVDIVQGGKSLIRLKDNGYGISKEDLPLAVSRHATSKLAVIEDLNRVVSLGFRGEALASISSISRLYLVSHFEKSDKAWSIDTGSDTDFTNYQAEVLPAALSVGTVIEVRDLFYNTPARRKFLRTDKTEFRYLEDVFKRIALSHFDVAFKLTHNKKLIKKLSAVSSPEDKLFRLQKIFGEHFVGQLKEVNQTSQKFHDLGCLQLTGWISNKSYFRSYADQQFFYVNGRYVRDKLLNHALRQAYQETLKEDQYAAYILYLDIDPMYVDVNVHPTKHEIRFSQTRMVHDFIVSAITRTLSPAIVDSNKAELKTVEIHQQQIEDNNSPFSKEYSKSYRPREQYGTISGIKDQIEGLSHLYKKPMIDEESNQGGTAELDKPLFSGKVLTLLGTTLLAQEDDSLWIVDSLAAAKIINCEVLSSSCFNKQVDKSLDSPPMKARTQKLLIPENIVLAPSDCELLLKWQQQLIPYGVEFTFCGPESLMLRMIPKLPFDLDNKRLISSIVSLLKTADSPEIETVHNSNWDQLFIRQLVEKISSCINPLQNMDKNKQQKIMDYLSESKYSVNNFTAAYNKTYQILNNSDMKKLI